MDGKFWMIVVDGGNAPTKRHTSLVLAREEAERLASKEGRRAHILESTVHCQPMRLVQWSDSTEQMQAVTA